MDTATIRVKAALPQRGPSVVPVEARLWLQIQTSPEHNHTLKPISKKAQTILRHEPHLREPDGARSWPKLTQRRCDPYPNTRTWMFSTWLDDQAGLDLNSALTHMENLSTSEQYRFTVAYQKLIEILYVTGNSVSVDSTYLPYRIFEQLQSNRRKRIDRGRYP